MNSDLQSVLLNADHLISDALVILNRAPSRIVLVVCKKGKLLGVVTDGDVRRGLLSGISIERQVVEIMNSKPLTANPETSIPDLLSIMNKNNIIAIPLMDHDIPVGLETLESISSISLKKDNPILIMAGGFGTRLRPLTDKCPKPMLKLDERPILKILLERFIKLGFENFYISTHYMPEVIQDFFGDGSRFNVNIQYVNEREPLGTGGSLRLLPEDIGDLPIIMINGDILTKVDFSKILDFHQKNSASATIGVRTYEYKVPYGVVEGDNNQVTKLSEKPTQKFFINAGIYVINPTVIKTVDRDRYIDMPNILENLIDHDKKVLMFPLHEYWLDIGRPDDFERARRDIVDLDI